MFEAARRHLTPTKALAFYRSDQKTRLITDASRLNGIGFVLKQEIDRIWKPVQAGSRFLTKMKADMQWLNLSYSLSSWPQRNAPTSSATEAFLNLDKSRTPHSDPEQIHTYRNWKQTTPEAKCQTGSPAVPCSLAQRIRQHWSWCSLKDPPPQGRERRHHWRWRNGISGYDCNCRPVWKIKCWLHINAPTRSPGLKVDLVTIHKLRHQKHCQDLPSMPRKTTESSSVAGTCAERSTLPVPVASNVPGNIWGSKVPHPYCPSFKFPTCLRVRQTSDNKPSDWVYHLIYLNLQCACHHVQWRRSAVQGQFWQLLQEVVHQTCQPNLKHRVLEHQLTLREREIFYITIYIKWKELEQKYAAKNQLKSLNQWLEK